MAVIDVDQAGRIGGHDQRVLSEGHARAAEALGLHAVAVVEIAVGGQSSRGGEQQGE